MIVRSAYAARSSPTPGATCSGQASGASPGQGDAGDIGSDLLFLAGGLFAVVRTKVRANQPGWLPVAASVSAGVGVQAGRMPIGIEQHPHVRLGLELRDGGAELDGMGDRGVEVADLDIDVHHHHLLVAAGGWPGRPSKIRIALRLERQVALALGWV